MSRYLAKYTQSLPDTIKKAVGANTSALTFDSLLTYPLHDLAGDYVEPGGCDFAPHKLTRAIDLEHSRHPLIKGAPVAWAGEDFEKAQAPYSVRMVEFDFPEVGTVAVPVGTEYYKASDPLSMQIFAMREQDALPGASLEFEMVPGFFKSIGYSELEKRDAYRFEKCLVHRWTVCERPVNPGALTLTKSLPQVPEALAKILTDKRVNVGGTYEPLNEMILKALAPVEEPAKPVSVRVEKAADAEMTTAAEVGATSGATETGAAKPTAQAAYNLAQRLADVADMLVEDMAPGEHKSGQKKLGALRDKIKTITELALSIGNEVGEDLDDGAAVSAEDMKPGDDGKLKGIPPRYAKAVKRFTLADLMPPAPAPAPESNEKVVKPPEEPIVPDEIVAGVNRLKRMLEFI